MSPSDTALVSGLLSVQNLLGASANSVGTLGAAFNQLQPLLSMGTPAQQQGMAALSYSIDSLMAVGPQNNPGQLAAAQSAVAALVQSIQSAPMSDTSASAASTPDASAPTEIQDGDTALSTVLQSVLDELAQSIQESAASADALLAAAVTTLRSNVRQANTAQQGVIESVIGELGAIINTGEQVSSNTLSPILAELSGMGVSVSAPTGPTGPTGPVGPVAPTVDVNASTSTAPSPPSVQPVLGPTGPCAPPGYTMILNGTGHGNDGAAIQAYQGPGGGNDVRWFDAGCCEYIAQPGNWYEYPPGSGHLYDFWRSNCTPTNPAAPPPPSPSGPSTQPIPPNNPTCPPPCAPPVIHVHCPPGPVGPTGPTGPTGPAATAGALVPAVVPISTQTGVVVPAFAPAVLDEADEGDRIGGKKWCAAMQTIIQDMSTFGIQIAAIAKSIAFPNGDPGGNTPWWVQAITDNAPFGLGQALGAAFAAGAGQQSQVYRSIAAMFSNIATLTSSLSCGDPTLVLGLVLTRGLITALKRLRIGTDLALWATVDIDLTWDQLEAAIEYLIKAACPTNIPGPQETIKLRIDGFITESRYTCWMLMNGCDPAIWRPSFREATPRPQSSEAMEAYARNWIDQPTYAQWLSQNGMDADQWQAIFNMSQPRPAAQERQQFLYRLRPGAPGMTHVYDDAQFASDLSHDGELQSWQDMRYELRYIPYTLREIRQLLDAGQIGYPETYNAFRDMGYADDKAVAQAQMEMVLTNRRRKSEIQGWSTSKISTLYKQRAIGRDHVISLMADLSYSAAQAAELMEVADLEVTGRHTDRLCEQAQTEYVATLKSWYLTGLSTPAVVNTSLQAAGATADCAASLANTWDAVQQQKYMAAAISAIKKGWESGFTSDVNAASLLQSAGMDSGVTAHVVAEWRGAEVVNQRMLGVQEVLANVKDSLISVPVALARMELMGWAPAEAEVLLMQVQKEMTDAETKATAATHASAARASKAAQALASRATQAQKAARTALKQLLPVSTMKTWLKKGIIGQDQFTERMLILGYAQPIIDATIKEACSAKTAVCVQSEGESVVAAVDPPGPSGPTS